MQKSLQKDEYFRKYLRRKETFNNILEKFKKKLTPNINNFVCCMSSIKSLYLVYFYNFSELC